MKQNNGDINGKARELLVQKYIEALEKDQIPWRKGWKSSSAPYNPITGTRYNGFNMMLLNYMRLEHEYNDQRWITFNQMKDKGYTFNSNYQDWINFKLNESIDEYISDIEDAKIQVSLRRDDKLLCDISIKNSKNIYKNIYELMCHDKRSTGEFSLDIELSVVDKDESLILEDTSSLSYKVSSDGKTTDILDIKCDSDYLTFSDNHNCKGLGVPISFSKPVDRKNPKRAMSWTEYFSLKPEEREEKIIVKKKIKVGGTKSKPVYETVEEEKDRYYSTWNNYTVYNAEIIDGLPELENVMNKVKATEFIDNLIYNMGVGYVEEGDRAFYTPSTDTVTVPPKASFFSQYEYDTTTLHELCHSTGHPNRMNRDLSGKFGSEKYAREELNVEIAVSMLAISLDLKPTDIQTDNHIAYVQSWIQAIKDDPDALFKAIHNADEISEYVLEAGEFELFKIRQDMQYLEAVNEPTAHYNAGGFNTYYQIYEGPSGDRYAFVLSDAEENEHKVFGYKLDETFNEDELYFNPENELYLDDSSIADNIEHIRDNLYSLSEQEENSLEMC